jgi:hypothetical protein
MICLSSIGLKPQKEKVVSEENQIEQFIDMIRRGNDNPKLEDELEFVINI